MCAICHSARITRNHRSTKRHREAMHGLIVWRLPQAVKAAYRRRAPARDWDAEEAEARSLAEWNWYEQV